MRHGRQNRRARAQDLGARPAADPVPERLTRIQSEIEPKTAMGEHRDFDVQIVSLCIRTVPDTRRRRRRAGIRPGQGAHHDGRAVAADRLRGAGRGGGPDRHRARREGAERGRRDRRAADQHRDRRRPERRQHRRERGQAARPSGRDRRPDRLGGEPEQPGHPSGPQRGENPLHQPERRADPDDGSRAVPFQPVRQCRVSVDRDGRLCEERAERAVGGCDRRRRCAGQVRRRGPQAGHGGGRHQAHRHAGIRLPGDRSDAAAPVAEARRPRDPVRLPLHRRGRRDDPQDAGGHRLGGQRHRQLEHVGPCRADPADCRTGCLQEHDRPELHRLHLLPRRHRRHALRGIRQAGAGLRRRQVLAGEPEPLGHLLRERHGLQRRRPGHRRGHVRPGDRAVDRGEYLLLFGHVRRSRRQQPA